MSLLPVNELLPEIKELATKIKSICYLMPDTQNLTSYTTFRIDDDFTMSFCDVEYEPYVTGNHLFIPVMSSKKLQGLPAFFISIDEPFVFEHEACHLIDNLVLHNTGTSATYNELEQRASDVELLLRSDQ